MSVLRTISCGQLTMPSRQLGLRRAITRHATVPSRPELWKKES